MFNKLPLILASFLLGVFSVVAIQYVSKTDPEPALPIPDEMKAKVYFDIGQHYFNTGENPSGVYNREMSRKYYQKAAELDPKVDLQLWYQLGRLDFIDADFDSALDKFATQMEYFGEELPPVLYMKGLTYGYRARQTNDPEDWRQAEINFINFLPYAPTSPWTRTDLAWVYFSQGKYEEMKSILEDGLANRSGHPWLLNMYGLALLNTGDPEEALENFLQAYNAAAELTEEEWGNAYPGNNPALWGNGLAEFRSIIDKNINLALSSSQ